MSAERSISKNLEALTSSLTQQYKARNLNMQTPSLAVFPLNSNVQLAEKHVGFALSELLTHQFVQVREFTVVERSELLRNMEEQRLQQSGAIDPDKAVKVGKLVGAELLVLGSVEKISQKYLVNTRLVQAETGSVLATAYEEIPADLFEQTAKPYLNLVPDVQSLGFYAIYKQHLESDG